MDWCESPPIFLSHEEDVDVYWEEPIFSDNSGKEVQVRGRERNRRKENDRTRTYKDLNEWRLGGVLSNMHEILMNR